MSSLTPLPRTGRLAGIDFGTRRVGVAISDAAQTLSCPLTTYTRSSEQADTKFFQDLARQEQIAGFVVGLPVHQSGSESGSSTRARDFADWLRQITNLPVGFVDERFSSVMAMNLLRERNPKKSRRKNLIDTFAAQVLLAAYLESPSSSDQAPGPLHD